MINIISQEEKDRIDGICKEYGITNYTINGDRTIDVDGDVYLRDTDLTELPLMFNKVSGNFFCSNNNLTSLRGCPKEVGGDFTCNENALTSLEFCPDKIGGFFNGNANPFTSLEFCPTVVGGRFYCGTSQLPEEYINLFSYGGRVLTLDEQPIFLKYQYDYEVWYPEFNEYNMNDLIADIKDGLQ